jgi:hypothetical protein
MSFRYSSRPVHGIILALLATTPAHALEWSMTPSLTLQEVYNDNIRLTTAVHESSRGTLLMPRIDLSMRSEIWDLSGFARLRNSHYSGIDGLDSNDELYNITGNYRTPRSQWKLTTYSNRESTLTGEYIDPDTGLTTTQSQRNTKSAELSWGYGLTQTTSLRTSYQYTDVVYPLGTLASLFDYQQGRTSLVLSNKYTERTEIFLTGSYSDYTVPANDYRSEQNTASLGLTHSLTETVQFTLSGGPRKTTAHGQVKYCPPPSTALPVGVITVCFDPDLFQVVDSAYKAVSVVTRGTTYNARLSKNFERTRLELAASRDIQPSGSGTETLTDTYTLNSSTTIDPRNTLSLSVTAYYLKPTVDLPVSDERRYYQAEPKWRWQCSEHCYIELSYRYSYLKYLIQDEPAKSNAYALTFYYQWPKMAVSR